MMIKCPECGKEISDKAENCPNCGFPITESEQKKKYETKKGTENNTYHDKEVFRPAGDTTKDIIFTVNGNTVNMSELWKRNKTKEKCIKELRTKYKADMKLATTIMDDFSKQSGIKMNKSAGNGCATLFLIVFFLCGILVMCDDKDNQNQETTQQETTQNVTTETAATQEVTTQEEPKETEEEYRNSCEEYAYKDVLRNPEDYIGKRVKIRVKISTVHEESILNATKYYFAYSESDYGWYGDYYGIFDERYDTSLKLLSDDIIEVYGEIAESEYTKSLVVASEEIFCIKMKYVDLIEE